MGNLHSKLTEEINIDSRTESHLIGREFVKSLIHGHVVQTHFIDDLIIYDYIVKHGKGLEFQSVVVDEDGVIVNHYDTITEETIYE